jgi:hypothetical protein
VDGAVVAVAVRLDGWAGQSPPGGFHAHPPAHGKVKDAPRAAYLA